MVSAGPGVGFGGESGRFGVEREDFGRVGTSVEYAIRGSDGRWLGVVDGSTGWVAELSFARRWFSEEGARGGVVGSFGVVWSVWRVPGG